MKCPKCHSPLNHISCTIDNDSYCFIKRGENAWFALTYLVVKEDTTYHCFICKTPLNPTVNGLFLRFTDEQKIEMLL